MDDWTIKRKLDGVSERLSKEGDSAKTPDPEEWTALFLAVRQLFGDWYNEFYR